MTKKNLLEDGHVILDFVLLQSKRSQKDELAADTASSLVQQQIHTECSINVILND